MHKGTKDAQKWNRRRQWQHPPLSKGHEQGRANFQRIAMPHLPFGLYVLLALIALAIVVFLVDRLLLWMERKGWIYYRMLEPRIKGGVRGVMGTFQEIVQPEIRHVREEQEQRKVVVDDQNASDR